jgi:hypothetical protein
MLTKIMAIAKSFRRSCQYICQDEQRSRVLATEGVRAHDPDLMAVDFEEQRQMRPTRENPALHLCLSFSPLDNPSDDLMVEIARKYMERIGMVDTQYAIVRHTDRPHPHMHLLINVVNNKGGSLDLGWLRLRTLKAARELAEEYKLTPANKKNLHLTHKENMNEYDELRYRIYEAMQNILPECLTLEDVEKRLLTQGVEVQYRLDKEGKRIGVSFKLENKCFPGYKIDREYSIKGLERKLALQRELALKQQQTLREEQTLKEQQTLSEKHYPRLRHHL